MGSRLITFYSLGFIQGFPIQKGSLSFKKANNLLGVVKFLEALFCFVQCNIKLLQEYLTKFSHLVCVFVSRIYPQGPGKWRVFEDLSTFRCMSINKQVSTQFLPIILQSSNRGRPVVGCYLCNRKPHLGELHRPTQHLQQGQLRKQGEETQAYYLTEQEVWVIGQRKKEVQVIVISSEGPKGKTWINVVNQRE